ncbi:phage tail sheath subtilisin-like domain-containing protein [Diaphorobacter caeni]|uniref:phage tail sheath subtilisin-like domain-containing protein n=1 Tax=Diaphorobacter caeni TaxID=2784387 RepID=UPI00188EC09F|nr:phage tail sheath subtilisin-like domain-containing protein [Diaphorobacter caeni]MBF5003375.1 phage tail sheath subtilisin-like domain-containing protein [Diaphorobacter caeni]
MAVTDYHHGVRVIELNEGTNSLRVVSTAIIGLVATASDADEAAFPLNKPVLFTSISKAQAAAGTLGTLSMALSCIADNARPVMVIVRVPDGEGATDEERAADQTSKVVGDYVGGVRTGIQALLTAEQQLGVKPRILGAPGLDTKPVAEALTSVAEKLRAMAYVYADGCEDVSDTLEYQQGFGKRETMLLWPNFTKWSTKENKSVEVPVVAYALGMRAAIDQTQGWHKSISNVAVNGPTGIAKDVYFDLQSPASDATLLNEGNVTTLIRKQGYRIWGNRTCSSEENFAFETATRTAHVLADTMAEGHFEFIDKPMTPSLIKDILEGINARIRQLKSLQYILDGNAWINEEVNTTESLKSGKLIIDYDYTPLPPLEDLTLRQRLTDQYWADWALRVSAGS